MEKYYYVVVYDRIGPVYVTDFTKEKGCYATWDMTKEPKELGKYMAEQIRDGLMMNFISCDMVCSPKKITVHPYRYDAYEIQWKERKESKIEI